MVDLTSEEQAEFDIRYQPIFIGIQVTVAVLFWVIGAGSICASPAPGNITAANATQACPNGLANQIGGLYTYWPHSILQFHDYNCNSYRFQVWRLLTYQFTHANMAHIGINTLMTLILGWFLERTNGHLRMCYMWNIGVLGGALSVAIFDCHAVVVGMSGGCYSLIGMYFGDLVLNWEVRKLRWFELGGVSLLILVDSLFTFVLSHGNSHTSSFVCHGGGVLTGFCIGLLDIRVIHETMWDRVWQKGAGVTVMICGIIAWGWLLFAGDGAMANIRGGAAPWCYLRQVSYYPYFKDPKWHCVYCHTKECMAFWDEIPVHTNREAVSQIMCHSYPAEPYYACAWHEDPGFNECNNSLGVATKVLKVV